MWKTYEEIQLEADGEDKWYVAKHPAAPQSFSVVRLTCSGHMYSTEGDFMWEQWLYFGEVNLEKLVELFGQI